MNKKEIIKFKVAIVGIFFLLFLFLIAIFFGKYFDDVQTSLVKYLDGANHQCVAYVERYYENMFNIKIKNVGRAMLLPKKAKKFGLFFHKNNGAIIPQPGDILVFGNKNTIGHVAIVTGVLPEGVFIVEQNWVPSKITTNNGKILPAEYKNGKYYIFSRYYDKKKKNKFWVIGWVSRTNKNPLRFFNFKKGDINGWLPEHNLKTVIDNKNAWTLKVFGRDPRILSPVFIDGLSVQNYNKIIFRVKVEKNNNVSGGVLYLRDEKGQWSEQIPFRINTSDDKFRNIIVDLSKLRKDFKITQLRLKLSNNSRYGEIWKVDWLRIGERHQRILK